jgi:hypothetical protein
MAQRTCGLLISVLALAVFADKDVESEATNLINQLEADLDEAGFEPSTDLEEKEQELEDLLNQLDTEREELEAVAAESGDGSDLDDDEETEDAGS